MKKVIIITTIISAFLIISAILIVKNKFKFEDLDIKKIEIYKVNLENDFNILNDYYNALEIKEYVKTIETKEIIDEFKKALTVAKKGRFDYIGHLDEYTNYMSPLPNNPNYILKMNIKGEEDLYLFYWLYEDQDQSYITYYKEKYNTKTFDRKNIVNLILTKEDTSLLRKYFN